MENKIVEKLSSRRLLRIERDLGVALSRSTTLRDALQHCLKAGLDAGQMDSGGIYLPQPEGSILLLVHHGLSAEFVDAVRRFDADSQSAQMALAGIPVYVEDQKMGVHVENMRNAEGLGAVAILPILADGEVIACMNLASHTDKKVELDIRQALESIAAWTGIAISRIQSEEALRESRKNLVESERRLALAIAATSDAIWELDLPTGETYCSARWYEMLGYEDQSFPMSFEAWKELCHPDDFQPTVDCFQNTLSVPLNTSCHAEFRMRHADGHWVWLLARGAVVSRDADGKPLRLSGTNTDISERKQSEAEHQRLEESLRQAQKLESIGRLAGGVAHDFNNLLTVITGHVSLALMRLEPVDPLYGPLCDVEKAADSAANLTRQLLAFSRKQVIEPRVLGLSFVMERATRMLLRLLGEDIELKVRLSEDTGRVHIDPVQMEQVLINLAVNARDAMPDGGTLTLATKNIHFEQQHIGPHVTLPAGSYVMLSISDTGCGMSEKVKSHLFEPFFTTKEVGKGTGLGLAMVYGALQQNGGGVDVYSEPGIGTTFHLYLPIVAEDLKEAPQRRAPELPRGSETVMLVEDDQMVRDLSVQLLADQGYEVHGFSRGDEALAGLEPFASELALLVTDVVMPGMNGKDLAKLVALRCPGLRVLFTSGYTENVIVHRGVVENGIDFLAKPYTPEQLCRRVRQVLDAPSRPVSLKDE
jgi:PAS domain S-box-containing protein